MLAPRAARIRSMHFHLWQLLVVTLAGWVKRFQQDAIAFSGSTWVDADYVSPMSSGVVLQRRRRC